MKLKHSLNILTPGSYLLTRTSSSFKSLSGSSVSLKSISLLNETIKGIGRFLIKVNRSTNQSKSNLDRFLVSLPPKKYFGSGWGSLDLDDTVHCDDEDEDVEKTWLFVEAIVVMGLEEEEFFILVSPLLVSFLNVSPDSNTILRHGLEKLKEILKLWCVETFWLECS